MVVYMYKKGVDNMQISIREFVLGVTGHEKIKRIRKDRKASDKPNTVV